MGRCYEVRDRRREGSLPIGDAKNRSLVIEALTSRMRAARCTPLHMHARTFAHGQSRTGTAMRDLVPLRRRSTFELGLPRSQLSPLRRRMSVEGQRECTTRGGQGRGQGEGDHLSRGCIRRACLTRAFYPSARRTRGQCSARPCATNALECAIPPVRLRAPAKDARF